MRTFGSAVALIIGSILAATDLAAQTSSGTFGARSVGGTVSAGQSSFGGTGSRGGAAGGTGATPGNGIQTTQQGAGQIDGSERFLRDSRQPGQFVGADTSDAQNFFSQGGMTGNQANQFRTGNNRNGNNNRNSNRQQGNNQFGGRGQTQQQNRLPLRLSASLIQRSIATSRVDAALSDRVESLSQPASSDISAVSRAPALTGSSSVQVSVEGQTAILRGTVSSDYERRLVSRMARLEPGIATVRNELQVDPTASSSPRSEALPTPTDR